MSCCCPTCPSHQHVVGLANSRKYSSCQICYPTVSRTIYHSPPPITTTYMHSGQCAICEANQRILHDSLRRSRIEEEVNTELVLRRSRIQAEVASEYALRRSRIEAELAADRVMASSALRRSRIQAQLAQSTLRRSRIERQLYGGYYSPYRYYGF